MVKKEGTGKQLLADFTASFGMLLIIFTLLLTSFQLAIYGDSDYKFYEKEYQKYHVTDALSMKLEDVMEVTDYMMDYLIGREEELSIVTEIEGRPQDFFNEQDRFHMGEVRELFLLGLKIRNVCGLIAVLLIAGLFCMKVDLKCVLFKAYIRTSLVLLVVGVLLGAAFALDFTRCFTIFHEIFFDNDLWMFNPSEDYMIRMLPEGFFSDMAARIGVIFIAMVLTLAAILFIWTKYVKHREK